MSTRAVRVLGFISVAGYLGAAITHDKSPRLFTTCVAIATAAVLVNIAILIHRLRTRRRSPS